MNTYLMHFGIKGQKWGIRRYQNPDGTLTEAGKRREAKLARLSSDERRYRELKTKKFSEMSNQEVNELNNREQLRQNYKRLNPNAFAKGVAAVAGITATMMVANKFMANGKVFVNNGKNIVNHFDKKFGDYYLDQINKAYKFRV